MNRLLTPLLLFCFFSLSGYGQCPTIEAMMVNACQAVFSEEGLNEFIILNSGDGFNVSELQLDFDNNNNIITGQNNDIHTNNGNFPSNSTPCGLQAGDPSVFSGCSNIIPIGPGEEVPANATVILQTSAGANETYDFSAFCGNGECIYIIQNTCSRSAGAFTNSGDEQRFTVLSLSNGSCSETYIYDLSEVPGGNGAFFLPPSTYGNNGCVSPPITPSQPEPLTLDALGPLCLGDDPVALPAVQSGISGNWEGPGVSGNSLSPDGLAGDTITLSFIPDAGQCALADSIQVAILDLISVSCEVVASPSAQGAEDGVAEINFSGGQEPYRLTVTSDITLTFTDLTAETFTLTGLSAGNYEVLVEDANGCSNTCSFIVNEPPCDLLLDITEVQDQSCSNTTDGAVSLNLQGGSPPVNYTWSDGDTTQGSRSGLSTGNYSVTVEDGNNCQSSVSFTIGVANDLPEVSISAGDTICAGQCFSFNLQFQGTPPFQLFFNAGAGGAQQPLSFSTMSRDTTLDICPADFGISSGTITASFTGLADANCEANLNQVEQATILPVLRGGLDTTLCTGDSLLLNGTVYNAANPSGTDTLATASGCDSILSVSLSFFPADTALLEPTLCAGDSLLINGTVYNEANPSGQEVLAGASANGCDSVANINLTFVEGASTVIDSTLCPGNVVVVNGQTFDENNSSGTVVIENGSVTGCDSTVEVSLTYRERVLGFLEGSTEICPGDSTQITIRLQGADAFNVTISDDSGPLRTFMEITDGVSFQVAPEQTTTYEISVLTAIGSLCPVEIGQPAVITVGVGDAEAQVLSDYNGFGLSCNGAQDGRVGVVNGDGLTYLWNTGATSRTLENVGAGVYTATITSPAGCSAQDSVRLNEPAPIVAKTSGVATGCFGEQGGSIILESLQGGAAPFAYSLDGGGFIPFDSPPLTIPNLSGGTYELVVRDANGCETSQSVVVGEPEELLLSLGGDKEVKLGDSVQLRPQASFEIASFSWSPLRGLIDSTALSPYAGPEQTTSYTLTATDESGCTASAEVFVFVNTQIQVYAPNAFSPDGDGNNDFFTLYGGAQLAEILSLQVFDRWGNLMFDGKGLAPNEEKLGWDGTFRGEEMDPGVYVFRAEIRLLNDNMEMLNGEVVLLR